MLSFATRTFKLKSQNNAMDLTVILVNFKSEALLNFNYQLLTDLNPNINLKWIVVDNTPNNEELRRHELDPRFTVLPSVARPEHLYGDSSYHHALGLNSCLPHIKTRYLLVLDPDFYIVMPNALAKVLDFIEKANAGFIGVPWHPKRSIKYRGFPVSIVYLLILLLWILVILILGQYMKRVDLLT